MAGKLRHLRFNDKRWEAFCATLPPGKSPTARLEELMAADVTAAVLDAPRRLCQRPTSASLSPNSVSVGPPMEPRAPRPCDP